jgi:hypothetical protein
VCVHLYRFDFSLLHQQLKRPKCLVTSFRCELSFAVQVSWVSASGAGSALTRVTFRSPLSLNTMCSSAPTSVVHFFGTHHPS